MPRLTKFDEYRDRYSDSYVLEKTDDGILLMRMHTDGGPVNWNKAVLSTPDLFSDIAGDRDRAARMQDRKYREWCPATCEAPDNHSS